MFIIITSTNNNWARITEDLGADAFLPVPFSKTKFNSLFRGILNQPRVILITSDPKSDISVLKASKEVEALHPEFNLNPAVMYIGLPTRFITGEVVLSDQPGECAEGIDVTLAFGDHKITVQTDNFGDFDMSPSIWVTNMTGETGEFLHMVSRVELDLDHVVISILPQVVEY